jgi:hypothetical protein
MVALAEDGTLYEWGGGTNAVPSSPTASSVSAKFGSISISDTHVLARATDGQIYSWAYTTSIDMQYALGTPKSGGAHPIYTPTAIDTGVALASVTAGSNVSFGITAGGVAYSWGARQYQFAANDPTGMFALGRGDDATPNAQPTPLATTEHFSRIVAGVTQVTALRADGVPFFWGVGLLDNSAPGGAPINVSVPTKMADVHLTSLVGKTIDKYGISHRWGAFDENGRVFGWETSAGGGRFSYDQVPIFMSEGGETPEVIVSRGSTERVAMQPYTEAKSLSASGIGFPPDELAPELQPEDQKTSSTNGTLDADGISYALTPPKIARGQGATVLAISAGAAATLGKHDIFVGRYSGVETLVLPPDPPPGTPLDIRCDVPESVVRGYWCLTNSGGATAPHKWKDLPLPVSTWRYENLCISYGANGFGKARFKNPDNTISERKIRYGVLSRSNGNPEVTDTGLWLLYHEGIGDPQVEQVTFNPNTNPNAVGESWPFTKGDCSF